MSSVVVLILIAILLVGVVFLFMPGKKPVQLPPHLNTQPIAFYEVEYLILLLSKSRTKSSPIEDLLQYKIIELLSRGTNEKCKKVILITGGPEDSAGSAIKNAREIRAWAASSSQCTIEVDIKEVLKIVDPHETFQKGGIHTSAVTTRCSGPQNARSKPR